MRLVVSVGTGKHQPCLKRLIERCVELGEHIHFFPDMPGPSHERIPFGFKVQALEEALKLADVLLWCDASVVIMKPLAPIWERIEQDGYWFSRNYEHMNGTFTSEAALPLLGVTKEQNRNIPHVVASCFGLDFRKAIGDAFFLNWKALMLNGSFEDRGGSSEPGFIGHRHDQTAASVVAWRLRMELTDPPAYFCEEGMPGSDETILTLKRCR